MVSTQSSDAIENGFRHQTFAFVRAFLVGKGSKTTDAIAGQPLAQGLRTEAFGSSSRISILSRGQILQDLLDRAADGITVQQLTDQAVTPQGYFRGGIGNL